MKQPQKQQGKNLLVCLRFLFSSVDDLYQLSKCLYNLFHYRVHVLEGGCVTRSAIDD